MTDLPRLRRHTDGRLGQRTGRDSRWPWHVTVPVGGEHREDEALCYHATEEQVRGEGWTSLAVVELPEPDAVTDHSEIGVRRATFGPIDGQAYLDDFPDTLSGWEIAYHSQGFSTDEDVDRLVAALLGARAWAKRERAVWAEHQGGEPR